MTKDNKKLQILYEKDIEERTNANWSDKKNVAHIDLHDKRRRKQIEKMISEGKVKTANDFHRAALIFHHGETIRDYKKANMLAKQAMEMGNEASKWLYAATMDRWLIAQKKPQKYGTQFKQNKKGEWKAGQIDPTTTDEERSLLNVPPIPEAIKIMKEKYKKI